jgi:hypothetical protein
MTKTQIKWNGSAWPGACLIPLQGATCTDWRGGWVVLMVCLPGVDNRKIPDLARKLKAIFL